MPSCFHVFFGAQSGHFGDHQRSDMLHMKFCDGIGLARAQPTNSRKAICSEGNSGGNFQAQLANYRHFFCILTTIQ